MAKFIRSEVEERCRTDISYLGTLTLEEDVMTSAFPAMYVVIFQIVTSNIDIAKFFLRYLIALPRGHAKTTFLKVVVCWFILFSDLKSFMIICANADLSEDILADIKDMLDTPDIIKVFGSWRANKTVDRADRMEMFFRGRFMKIESKTPLSKVRGKTRRGRPQLYLVDDFITREDTLSPSVSKQRYDWLLSTLLKGRDNKRAIVLYCGNKYPNKNCIVGKLQKHPNWMSLVTGALLSDGTALWSEIKTKEDLIDEYLDDLWSGVPEIFVAEVLNGQTEGLNADIRIDKIPIDEGQWDNEPVIGRFIMVDLATDKLTPDQVSISVNDLLPDNVIVNRHLETNKLSHDAIAERCVELAITHQVPLIAYEDVGFQWIMKRETEKVIHNLGIMNMQVAMITPNGKSKTFRIVTHLFKSLLKLPYEANATRLSKETRVLVTDEISNFDLSITSNIDDILDNLAYTRMLVNDDELAPLCYLPLENVMSQEVDIPMVVGGNTSF